jgi:hypothetical protein
LQVVACISTITSCLTSNFNMLGAWRCTFNIQDWLRPHLNRSNWWNIFINSTHILNKITILLFNHWNLNTKNKNTLRHVIRHKHLKPKNKKNKNKNWTLWILTFVVKLQELIDLPNNKTCWFIKHQTTNKTKNSKIHQIINKIWN